MDEQAQSQSGEGVAVPKKFPTVWAAIISIVLFFVLQVITGIVAVAVALVAEGVTTPQAAIAKASDLHVVALPTIWGLVASSLISIWLFWLYTKRPDRWEKLGMTRWSKLSVKRTIMLSALLIFIGLGFNYAYTAYVIPDIKIQNEVHQLFAAVPKTIFNQILLFVTVAILAPVTEELLFRGLLQTSLNGATFYIPKTQLSWTSGPWASVIIASAIFAAIHMDFYAFPALFVLGCSFAILYQMTGSMRINILLHVINNGAAMLLGGS